MMATIQQWKDGKVIKEWTDIDYLILSGRMLKLGGGTVGITLLGREVISQSGRELTIYNG